MSVKQVVKKIMPAFIWRQLRNAKENIVCKRAGHIQASRFLRWMSREDSKDAARIETRLAFDVHRLEKGLSHTQFRYGFGKGVLGEISGRMVLLEQADAHYAENPLYRQGLSVLHEYQQRHIENKYDLTDIASMFPKHIWQSAMDYEPDASSSAGSVVMDASSKADNLSKGFVQLAQNRYSVREYSSEPVSQKTLNSVYEVSMKTPSVCNRQATRIYQISDPEKIKRTLKIQGGLNGYSMPPVLLLITSDIRAFMMSAERNEPFVDGGLFSMSLLYALEAYGLAACPLNAMFNLSQDKATRKLLNLPDNELPIMYIAVGNFPDRVPVCRSVRRKPKDIVTII